MRFQGCVVAAAVVVGCGGSGQTAKNPESLAATYMPAMTCTTYAKDEYYTRKVDDMRKACNANDDRSCYLLAKRLGAMGKSAPAEAIQRRLCKTGMKDACYTLARNRASNAPKLDKLCADGHPAACLTLLKRNNLFPGTDKTKSVPLAVRGCSLGEPEACVYAAKHDRSNAPPRYRRAIGLYLQRCDKCDAFACNAASRLIGNGKGIAADKQRAGKLRKYACKLHPEGICQWTM